MRDGRRAGKVICRAAVNWEMSLDCSRWVGKFIGAAAVRSSPTPKVLNRDASGTSKNESSVCLPLTCASSHQETGGVFVGTFHKGRRSSVGRGRGGDLWLLAREDAWPRSKLFCCRVEATVLKFA